MVRQLLGLVLLLALVSGCGRARVTFEAAPARTEVSASDVEAGEALYPFSIPAGLWGYMDATGRVVVEPAYQSVEPFSEGRAVVRVGAVYGYIAPDGRVAVAPQFAFATAFSQGRAVVAEGPTNRLRYGFVDPGGAVVVPLILPLAYSYSEGRALVRLREQSRSLLKRIFSGLRQESVGFIDLEGDVEFYVPDEAASFSEGVAPFSSPRFFTSGRWGYLRPDGSVAIPPQFRGAAFRFSDGLARVAQGNGVGFIDASGDLAFDQTFALALSFSEGLAAVQVDGQWGYIDTDGRLAILPQFSQAGSFVDGLAAVEVGGQWGYVGPDGEFAIEPSFRAAQAFRGPLAYVTDASGSHYIDRDGQAVLPDIAPR